jgi:2'-5' RNA ligase
VKKPLETALVIVVDDAGPFDDVRREFAAATLARGVPFHVTLQYPFAPREDVTQTLLHHLRTFAGRRRSLDFALTRVASWPRVVYAVPEPDDALRSCMHALWAEFPQWPPCEGAFSDVVPHATLAEDVDGPDVRDEIASRLEPHLPRQCQARDVVLLEEFEPDRWRERERFPFGA